MGDWVEYLFGALVGPKDRREGVSDCFWLSAIQASYDANLGCSVRFDAGTEANTDHRIV